MHPALRQTGHRPWPLPQRPWRWRQSWRDLLFAHWPLPVHAVRPLVPPELEIDERDGTSWIGIVPFRMSGVALRPLPDLPGISAFPEINVRLYVTDGKRPGVWFLSLDATQPLAVRVARRWFHLPYHRADITVAGDGEGVEYASERHGGGAIFRGRYGPVGDPLEADPGGLVRWLAERYCLYARDPRGALWRTDVHHAPWPLRDAEARIEVNTMCAPVGLELPDVPPLLHFSRRLDVVVWSPVRA